MNETEFCIICGNQYSLSDIESLGWEKFNVWAHSHLPKQLFKYYPNKVSVDGKNHSIESLTNGAVYINDAERFDDCFDCAIDMEWSAFYEKRIKRYCTYSIILATILPFLAISSNSDADVPPSATRLNSFGSSELFSIISSRFSAASASFNCFLSSCLISRSFEL